MGTYLLINLAIIAGPFGLSFLPWFRFYRRWPAVLAALAAVGALFIGWDVLVTWRGDWAFNPQYISGLKLLGLPVEEWLFFVTVPYSCLFLYEQMATYLRDATVEINARLYFWLALACFTGALLNTDRGYTCLVLALTGLIFLSARIYHERVFASRLFWWWMAICMLLFYGFNYILTALPVISYAPAAVLGVRVGTIPLEDFFYNFTMLTLYLAVYRRFRRPG
ncbi:MAG: lycopene cyclase domain-containing protein [Candidatus Margulisiibacteriota bacterium]